MMKVVEFRFGPTEEGPWSDPQPSLSASLEFMEFMNFVDDDVGSNWSKPMISRSARPRRLFAQTRAVEYVSKEEAAQLGEWAFKGDSSVPFAQLSAEAREDMVCQVMALALMRCQVDTDNAVSLLIAASHVMAYATGHPELVCELASVLCSADLPGAAALLKRALGTKVPPVVVGPRT